MNSKEIVFTIVSLLNEEVLLQCNFSNCEYILNLMKKTETSLG